jgi:hypothetical protein
MGVAGRDLTLGLEGHAEGGKEEGEGWVEERGRMLLMLLMGLIRTSRSISLYSKRMTLLHTRYLYSYLLPLRLAQPVGNARNPATTAPAPLSSKMSSIPPTHTHFGPVDIAQAPMQLHFLRRSKRLLRLHRVLSGHNLHD